MRNAILVTGGAGFIGSNFILKWLAEETSPIVNLDKLTYAGNPANLASVAHDPRYRFVQGDICDQDFLDSIVHAHRPRAIVHFAAESHVDRSIHAPDDFVATNVVGTVNLLQVAKRYWSELVGTERSAFRFLHVSTDEVYGSLAPGDNPFSELSRYDPRSPYSASKASADHFVRAWHHTYALPILVTNCSNNYGPFQFPEKLIPLTILNAKEGRPIPVYGDGMQVRDWLHVSDHCAAIMAVLEAGTVGETYNIGGLNEKTNLDVIGAVCDLLDERLPAVAQGRRRNLITFVKDRPGHDRRYAIDPAKIQRELNWTPRETFETGIAKTVDWYIRSDAWVESVVTGDYRRWLTQHYGGAET